MAGKETQQFCVRWNSYQSNLQSAFPKLLSCEHFVDVTLACESRMVKCHKVVLSACSAYFEKLLVQNPCQHPIIFMKDMKFWEVQALVDFMYKGEVNVTQDELATLLKAAEALEVRGLCGQQEGLAEKLSLPRGGSGGGGDSGSADGASRGSGGEPQVKARRVEAVVKEEQPSSASEGAHSTSHNPPTPEQNRHISQSSMNIANVKQESRFSDNGLFDDFDDDFYQDDNSLQIDETGSAYSLPGPSTQLDSSPGGKYMYCRSWMGGEPRVESEGYLDSTLTDVSMLVNGLPIPTSNKWRRDQRIYGIAAQDLLADAGPWHLNNGYPNVILTEPNYSSPSPSSETPGKVTRIRRSDAELLSAADSICKGMTFQKASQVFNIPMSTIRFYMARKGMLPSRRRGRRISQSPMEGPVGMGTSPGGMGASPGGMGSSPGGLGGSPGSMGGGGGMGGMGGGSSGLGGGSGGLGASPGGMGGGGGLGGSSGSSMLTGSLSLPHTQHPSSSTPHPPPHSVLPDPFY